MFLVIGFLLLHTCVFEMLEISLCVYCQDSVALVAPISPSGNRSYARVPPTHRTLNFLREFCFCISGHFPHPLLQSTGDLFLFSNLTACMRSILCLSRRYRLISFSGMLRRGSHVWSYGPPHVTRNSTRLSFITQFFRSSATSHVSQDFGNVASMRRMKAAFFLGTDL